MIALVYIWLLCRHDCPILFCQDTTVVSILNILSSCPTRAGPRDWFSSSIHMSIPSATSSLPAPYSWTTAGAVTSASTCCGSRLVIWLCPSHSFECVLVLDPHMSQDPTTIGTLSADISTSIFSFLICYRLLVVTFLYWSDPLYSTSFLLRSHCFVCRLRSGWKYAP